MMARSKRALQGADPKSSRERRLAKTVREHNLTVSWVRFLSGCYQCPLSGISVFIAEH